MGFKVDREFNSAQFFVGAALTLTVRSLYYLFRRLIIYPLSLEQSSQYDLSQISLQCL